MTDDRHRRLERLFDGEAEPADPGPSLAGTRPDGSAARYLDALAALRALAERHDPAAAVPVRSRPWPPPARPRRARWPAYASIAAGVLILLSIFAAPRGAAPPDPAVVASRAPASALAQRPRPPRDVELYRLANQGPGMSETAARLLLSPGPATHRRDTSTEILALELANPDASSAARVRRLAAARRPGQHASARSPAETSRGHRPHPDA